MIDISHALTIDGWMSPNELTFLAETAAKIPEGGAIVEIGSFKGRSSSALAANTRATVYCVDVWRDWHPSGGYFVDFDTFHANTARFRNIFPVQRPSVDAARAMTEMGIKPDVVFIDAAHDELNFRQDIVAWRPLLVDGGVLCGHDYGFTGWPDVKMVVDELFPDIRVVDTIWIAS